VAERVWIVSELYYPEDTSTGYFLTRIAEDLARSMPVSVLCGQPTYSARGTRAPRREIRSGVQIRRCAATKFDKDKLLLRLVNSVTLGVSILVRALWCVGRGEKVMVVTNPPLLPFLIGPVCHLRRAPFLLLVHDVYPEALVATGLVRQGGTLTRLLSSVTRLLYRSATRVIVLGRDMKTLAVRKRGGDARAVIIIPHWGDVDDIVPTPRAENELLRRLCLEDKFVVQYSGNMGRPHALELVIDAAQRLRDRKDVHFLFVGTGARRRWLEAAVEQGRLDTAHILPYLPRGELRVSLNACDVAVIPLVPGMSGVSVPSRMYNVLAAGKPIIAVADETSELARVIREERIGWVLPENRADILAETILEARARPGLLAEMAVRARAAAEEKYTLDRASQAYRALIESI
jgi:colanic acid biosynthesis glycosyl transferase WcaI